MAAFKCFGFLVFMECTSPTPEKTVTVVCPPVIQWPADLQKRAAVELGTLPPGAALNDLVALAIRQRDVSRRCDQSGKAPKKK